MFFLSFFLSGEFTLFLFLCASCLSSLRSSGSKASRQMVFAFSRTEEQRERRKEKKRPHAERARRRDHTSKQKGSVEGDKRIKDPREKKQKKKKPFIPFLLSKRQTIHSRQNEGEQKTPEKQRRKLRERRGKGQTQEEERNLRTGTKCTRDGSRSSERGQTKKENEREKERKKGRKSERSRLYVSVYV